MTGKKILVIKRGKGGVDMNTVVAIPVVSSGEVKQFMDRRFGAIPDKQYFGDEPRHFVGKGDWQQKFEIQEVPFIDIAG